jgi:hypothetical protein
MFKSFSTWPTVEGTGIWHLHPVSVRIFPHQRYCTIVPEYFSDGAGGEGIFPSQPENRQKGWYEKPPTCTLWHYARKQPGAGGCANGGRMKVRVPEAEAARLSKTGVIRPPKVDAAPKPTSSRRIHIIGCAGGITGSGHHLNPEVFCPRCLCRQYPDTGP